MNSSSSGFLQPIAREIDDYLLAWQCLGRELISSPAFDPRSCRLKRCHFAVFSLDKATAWQTASSLYNSNDVFFLSAFDFSAV